MFANDECVCSVSVISLVLITAVVWRKLKQLLYFLFYFKAGLKGFNVIEKSSCPGEAAIIHTMILTEGCYGAQVCSIHCFNLIECAGFTFNVKTGIQSHEILQKKNMGMGTNLLFVGFACSITCQSKCMLHALCTQPPIILGHLRSITCLFDLHFHQK